jgi:carbon-monoxide dehydrogenase small subunit
MDEYRKTIRLTVNGSLRELQVDTDLTLLELLREHLGLTGTKINCQQGECGACTVLLDGQAVNSCLVLAATLDGRSVTTIEGLAADGTLDPLQEAFIEADGSQCGYCTPGMIMSARALLQADPDPTREEILRALSGNYCRCTGYKNIIEAVLLAGRRIRERSGES